MRRALAAEGRKLTTLRAPKIALALALVADVVFVIGLLFAVPADALAEGEQQRRLVGGGFAPLVVSFLAITLLAGERSHGTLATTLLIQPLRERLVAVKALTAVLLGLTVGVVGTALVTAAVAAGLAVRDVDPVVDGALVVTLLGSVLSCVVLTVLLFGLGAALGNQRAAMVTYLVWIFMVESLLTSLADLRGTDVDRFLPFQALTAMQSPGEVPLTMWAAVLVACTYTAIALTAGWIRTTRTDVN